MKFKLIQKYPYDCPICGLPKMGSGNICQCNNITDPDEEITTIPTDLH